MKSLDSLLNTFTTERICNILGIDSPDEFWEKNIHQCECQTKGEEYWDYYKKEYIIAERDWTCESCSFDYVGKVESFFEQLLGKFKLELIKKKNGEYEIRPLISRDWATPARELIQTINGYGPFYFSSLGAAVASGPYKSAKDFVLRHIAWVSSYYEVYEGSKAGRIFERHAFGR